MIEPIELERVTPQAWRNGGGQTRELLAWPAAADWAVRISVADIRADGPFSAFPGIDRRIAVLSGAGVLLRWPERREMLTGDGPAAAFDGGQPPRCELLGGPTRDLNLMTRQEAGRGAMEQVLWDQEWLDAAPLRAVFTTAAAQLQIDDADACRLPPWSLAWSNHAGRQRWRLLGDHDQATAWWMSFRPRPQ